MIAEDNQLHIPEHVAIILDGNGRWAKRHSLPRAMGHKEGCDVLEKTVRICADEGIKYLTVYGFSTENWKRSTEEVGALMQLFRIYLKRLLKVALETDTRVLMIGDKSRFDIDIIKGIDELVSKTKDNKSMTFTIAVNYGSRDEITRTVKDILKEYKDKPFDISSIDEKFISDRLDTRDIPDPDLLIRTGGELRLSNYLLWQCAYTEIYITDTLWPDFTKDTLLDAIISYNKRDRRYGGRHE